MGKMDKDKKNKMSLKDSDKVLIDDREMPYMVLSGDGHVYLNTIYCDMCVKQQRKAIYN